MLHACAVKFDVTGNLENFCKLNKALASLDDCTSAPPFFLKRKILYAPLVLVQQNHQTSVMAEIL